MKGSIATKLKAYSTLAGVTLISSANAEIIYTDINPDYVSAGYGSQYDLDLNNDSINDYRIEVNGYSTATYGTSAGHNWAFIFTFSNLGINGFGSNNNMVGRATSSYSWQAAAMPSGSVLSAYQYWVSATGSANIGWFSYYFSSTANGNTQGPYTSSVGAWLNQTDKYIGLQFEINGVYHYGWVRKPDAMQRKSEGFNKLYHDDQWFDEHWVDVDEFDYSEVDALALFEGTHPEVMQARIAEKNWKFDFDLSKNKYTLKDRFKRFVEKLTGHRPFEYRNYKIVK